MAKHLSTKELQSEKRPLGSLELRAGQDLHILKPLAFQRFSARVCSTCRYRKLRTQIREKNLLGLDPTCSRCLNSGSPRSRALPPRSSLVLYPADCEKLAGRRCADPTEGRFAVDAHQHRIRAAVMVAPRTRKKQETLIQPHTKKKKNSNTEVACGDADEKACLGQGH